MDETDTPPRVENDSDRFVRSISFHPKDYSLICQAALYLQQDPVEFIELAAFRVSTEVIAEWDAERTSNPLL